jgi:hypothetical protein
LINIRYSLFLNSAQAGLKQGTPAGARLAIDQCSRALNLDEKPVDPGVTAMPGELRKIMSPEEKAKAYYRRAMAYNAVNEPDNAFKDLQVAAEFVSRHFTKQWHR